jgi:acetyl-CoA carboxylase biotin carboxyl carrier protein
VAVQKKASRSGAKKASRKRKPKVKTVRVSTEKRGKSIKAVRSAAKKTAAKAGRSARPARSSGKAGAGRKSTRKKAASTDVARGFPEISDLAELMEQHGLVEVEYERSKDGATRIHVKRAGAAPAAGSVAPVGSVPAAPVVEVASAAAEAQKTTVEDLHAFKSPMVGTFYRAPSPEASSFASVGDSVEAAGTVCIIEAMKVMNEITPDISGEVVSIEVENGEAVEFGQTLMLIRTH